MVFKQCLTASAGSERISASVNHCNSTTHFQEEKKKKKKKNRISFELFELFYSPACLLVLQTM
jgi:hypothetical protein